MLNSENITHAAQRACLGLEATVSEFIKILPGPFKSQEHHLVQQYDAITDANINIDRLAFKIGGAFLESIAQNDPENPTVKCLLLANACAFREPTIEERKYLIDQAAAQEAYGFDATQYALDDLQYIQPDLAVTALKQKFMRAASLSLADLNKLYDLMKIAHGDKENDPAPATELLNFTKLLRASSIIIPQYEITASKMVEQRQVIGRCPA